MAKSPHAGHVLSELTSRFRSFASTCLPPTSPRRCWRSAAAVYAEERIAPIPAAIRPKFLFRSKDRGEALVRIHPTVRQLVTYRRQNLIDSDYGITEPVDVIFCRNVFICFYVPTQDRILQRFCRLLVLGGFLFLGPRRPSPDATTCLAFVASTTYRALART